MPCAMWHYVVKKNQSLETSKLNNFQSNSRNSGCHYRREGGCVLFDVPFTKTFNELIEPAKPQNNLIEFQNFKLVYIFMHSMRKEKRPTISIW
jgi:hypothetical protein